MPISLVPFSLVALLAAAPAAPPASPGTASGDFLFERDVDVPTLRGREGKP